MLLEDLNALKPTLANTVLSKVFHNPTTRAMNHLLYWSVLYLTGHAETQSLVTLAGHAETERVL